MPTTRQLFVSLKTQDKLREWFSKRGNFESLVLNNIILGDSDINYELSSQLSKVEILPAPYQIPQIKYKLLYEGSYNGIDGVLNTYIRKIDSKGNVLSNYSSKNNFEQGIIIPKKNQIYNINIINFSNNLEGYIVFLETLPTGYKDLNGNSLRLVEDYDISFENLPSPLSIQIKPSTQGNNECVILSSENAQDLLSKGNIVAIQSNINPKLNGLIKIFDVGDNQSFYITDIYDVPLLLQDSENVTLYFYQTTFDKVNNSLIIAKGDIKLQNKSDGKIKIQGKKSGIKKDIIFNY